MPEIAVFDHYEVLTREDGSPIELGRGAMGITYKAFDTRLRIPVALKVITGAYLHNEMARQRFLREARSAAKLRHRNVATVFHLGSEGDGWFYAMEFIDGETVENMIRREGPLRPRMALLITAQVARALNAAARHGLVHRDIKPANLMLIKEDDELIAKVIDFGLAKTAIPGEGEDAATVSMGGFVGTFAFASPEQLEEKEIDSRSDIYSLGITLWYMLAGEVPFGGSMAQVISQHLSKPPPFEKFENLPAPVAEVLRKMLEKDRTNRFQTPLELRTAVEACLNETSDGPAVASAPTGEENLGMMLDDAGLRAGDTRFEIGVVLGRKYRITEVLAQTSSGRVFRATNVETQSDVNVLVLHPDFVADSAACTALEREVEKLAEVRHPNLLGVRAFETVDEASFVVTDWTDGFSLLELLRARRELDAVEVKMLLRQAAAGVDYALSLELTGLAFDLRQVLLHFPQSCDKTALLRTALQDWPEFELKLNPLAVARDLVSSPTWAGAQTMVGGTLPANRVTELRPRYIQSLATMIYELLGGARTHAARAGHNLHPERYAPLSTLSEDGNEVLKRALNPARSYDSAQEFSDALTAISDLQVRRHDFKASTSARSEPAGVEVPAETKKRPARRSSKGNGSSILAGLTAMGVVLGIWAYVSLPHAPVKTPVKMVSATPAPKPKVTEGKPGGDEGKETQGFDEGFKLWTGAGTGSPDPVNAVAAFQDAAEKGDPAASCALGECYLSGKGVPARDEQRALELFRASANAGDVQAMNRLGDCLVHGIGGKTDYAEALQLFTRASEKDLEALGNLGVLYINGEGITANPAKGEQLIEKGAQGGNGFCMRLYAQCLENAVGVGKNEDSAKLWYGAAAKAGDKRAAAWCRQHGFAVAPK